MSAAASEVVPRLIAIFEKATPIQQALIYAMVLALSKGRPHEAALAAEVFAHDAGQVADPALFGVPPVRLLPLVPVAQRVVAGRCRRHDVPVMFVHAEPLEA